jgi:glycosyltransferase involved in cell wall biosynthesis
MAKLSVVLATYNEEKNLSDCLKSVENIAAEIIIVDGSSQDKTVEIAKSYGAKVQIVENQKIFHINKQKAIDSATKDWVLQLDADERVTIELSEEIENSINNPNGFDGFWIPRKNWFLGRYLLKGGVYPDYTLRLYKKGKGRLPMKDVHEQAIVDGKVGFLKNPLEHMADPSFSRYLLRFNRYTDLIATQLKEKNNKTSPFMVFEYLLILPVIWFFKVYIRHLGFLDGWQGFVWSFFSALRFPVSYSKFLQKK